MPDTVEEAPKHQYTLTDLEHAVVASSLQDTDILEYVAARYRNRFSGRLLSLFAAAEVYFTHTRGLLNRDALAQILANSEPNLEKHQDYLSLFDILTSSPYSEYKAENRRWFIYQYDEEWKRDTTGQILAGAAEAMRAGHVAHGRKLVGPDAAWQFMQEQRLKYESTTRAELMSEAELTATTDQAKQDYIKAQESPYLGQPFSIPELNQIIGGVKPGSMHIVTAYSSEGKSFMMLNDAYEGWKSGSHCAIATGEMSVQEYRARFMALHSWHLAAAGKIPEPVPTTGIERGELTTQQHENYLTVLDDIKNSSQYGKMFIFKFPYGATPTMLFNKFSGYDQIVPLDFLVIDYLGLCASDRMRVSRREELDDLIRQTKAYALNFRGGDGVSLTVGYQVNRQSFERARAEGNYTLTCFSESSEAEKSADTAVYLLSQPQNPEELKVGVLKNRSAELGEPFYVRRAFQYAYMGSLRGMQHPTPQAPGGAMPLGGNNASVLDV